MSFKSLRISSPGRTAPAPQTFTFPRTLPHTLQWPDTVEATLKSGDKVQLVGFGTFEAKERAARTGKNPATGATIEIAASKAPVFKAGKAFKDSIQ